MYLPMVFMSTPQYSKIRNTNIICGKEFYKSTGFQEKIYAYTETDSQFQTWEKDKTNKSQ